MIIAGAGVKRAAGSLNPGVTHIMDVAPTLLEVAGVQVPATYEGKPMQKIQGKSLVATLQGKAEAPRGPDDWLGWELWGSRAIRQGDWKLLWQPEPMGKADWELYNIAKDPGERTDRSSQEPDRKRRLMALWDEYVKTNNVILPDRSPFETLKDQLPPRVPVQEGYPPLKYKEPFVPPAELRKDQ
jgi:arylsulfatase